LHVPTGDADDLMSLLKEMGGEVLAGKSANARN